MSDSMNEEHSLAAYTMSLLRCGDKYLLLKRYPDKRFAPGRWSGIGGRVEPHEFELLESSALREIEEETGYPPSRINSFHLRRALIQMRPGHPMTVLLYFTGMVCEPGIAVSTEGELHWLSPAELAEIDIIENTAQVIPRLVEDLENDPDGTRTVAVGTASFDATGHLVRIQWSDGQ